MTWLGRLLDDPDFFVGQAIAFVDELVDPAVGGVDLALNGRLVRRGHLAVTRP